MKPQSGLLRSRLNALGLWEPFWYRTGVGLGTQTDQEHGLRHQLSAGQMSMLAVGGSIGTGLLLGSAAAMEIAGPGVMLSLALAAFMSFIVALVWWCLACV